jgi:hypothetical protein
VDQTLKPSWREMFSPAHCADDLREPMEVGRLHDEWVALEEGHDRRLEPFDGVHGVCPHRTWPSLGSDVSAAEEANQCFQYCTMRDVLVHVKDGMELRSIDTEKQPSPSTNPHTHRASS